MYPYSYEGNTKKKLQADFTNLVKLVENLILTT